VREKVLYINQGSHPVDGSGGGHCGVQVGHCLWDVAVAIVGGMRGHYLVVWLRSDAGEGVLVRILIHLRWLLHCLYLLNNLFLFLIGIQIFGVYFFLRSHVFQFGLIHLFRLYLDFRLYFLFFHLGDDFESLPGLHILDLFFELLENPEAKLFLAFLLALSLFVDERVVPVLDHMFRAGFLEDGHQFAPTLAVLKHEAEDLEVFLGSPQSSFLLVVEVVEPPFAAMFGRLEDGTVGVVEESLGDVIPPQILFILDGFDEPVVFLSGPCDLGVRFHHAEELEMEELRILVEKCRREGLPLFGSLYRRCLTISLAEIWWKWV
jgi:hypothetical protein